MGKIVTDIGLSIVSQRIDANGMAKPIYIGWGTGSTEPVSGNTTLETEDTTGGYGRATGTTSIGTISATNDTYIVTGSLTAQAALTITEWGLFTASTSGYMLCREVYAAGYSLSIGGILNFIFKIQVSR